MAFTIWGVKSDGHSTKTCRIQGAMNATVILPDRWASDAITSFRELGARQSEAQALQGLALLGRIGGGLKMFAVTWKRR